MKILLITRIMDYPAREYSNKLRLHLEQLGHQVICGPEDLRADKAMLFDPNNPPDLAVVIGGDGTILLTSQAMPVQIPLIGVNWGEVGFLADLEPDEAYSFFEKLVLPIKVEERMRIMLSIDGACIENALNEVLIVTDRPSKMLTFRIHIDDVIAERFRADGLLISTPTGSTAYALSAGGPIVDPIADEFLIVPLAPFMLSNRPHLIDSSRSVRISLEAEKPAKLVIDGLIVHHIRETNTLGVYRSPYPALFVDTGLNFFEKINRKLKHL